MKPIVKVRPSIYGDDAEPGNFGYITNGKVNPFKKAVIPDWHSCRETFNTSQESAARLLFVADVDNNRRRVVSFIKHAERIIGVPEKSRAKFNLTNVPGVIFINMGRFWSYSKVRRSLFTILLRASDNYDPKKKDFELTAKANEYLSDTWAAFERFMQGHTTLKRHSSFDDYDGWYDFFLGKDYIDDDTNDRELQLVKPHANRKRT